jgi:hypothetical protein
MIYIVTACSRPQNLPKLARSIPPECRWIITFDGRVKPVAGYGFLQLHDPNITGVRRDPKNPVDATDSCGVRLHNMMLDTVQFEADDWLHILDDDNVLHPEWYVNVKPHCIPSNNLICWGQLKANGRVRLHPTGQPRVGNIDAASFMWRYGFKPELRFVLDYRGDGMFVAALNTPPAPPVVIDKYICYYNKLRG